MTESRALHEREQSLRTKITEKPKNGKAVAQLSSLLLDRCRADGDVDEKLRDEAISYARRSIEVAPKRPFGYTALSTASKDALERMEALQQAVDLSTDDQFLVAHIGLLVRLLIEPREEESLQVRGKVGKGSKEHPNRRDLNKPENDLYAKIRDKLHVAWDMKPGELSSAESELLCRHEYRLGLFFRKKLPAETHIPRARNHFEQSRQLKASNFEMAGFWMATLGDTVSASSNHPSIDKCPADYVVGLYSTFAERFDELLVEKLGYQTPTKLRKLLDSVVGDNTVTDLERGLDLGCGTGLSGLAFEDLVPSLIGVDLSPEMIQKAKQRDCYDDLLVGDVTTALQEQSGTFDLILACDVFCYIGDLNPVFQAASQSLSLRGLFCFSTELLPDSADVPFQLHSCARFSHQRKYVERLAETWNFDVIKMKTAAIRKNQGEDVMGLLAIFRQSVSS